MGPAQTCSNCKVFLRYIVFPLVALRVPALSSWQERIPGFVFILIFYCPHQGWLRALDNCWLHRTTSVAGREAKVPFLFGAGGGCFLLFVSVCGPDPFCASGLEVSFLLVFFFQSACTAWCLFLGWLPMGWGCSVSWYRSLFWCVCS